jgi:hypothetical protein
MVDEGRREAGKQTVSSRARKIPLSSPFCKGGKRGI